MPYLIDEDKNRLKKDNTPKKAGEINYRTTLVYLEKLKNWNKKKIILLGRKPKAIKYPALEIAQILDQYINDGDVKYDRYNDCGGAVLFATFEFVYRNPYRMPDRVLDWLIRVTVSFLTQYYAKEVVGYEKIKIKENGDVYPKEV